ncbi:MAG: shikimate kinase [Bacteroidales bacterium]|jgi:shikimate kinase|nr:shikimate kinase [Bacteroidales bacterium]MDD2687244.1 shikimate kinase [Bacteroidales bacterium]MDD3329843.1 shikimate kinase [Bacteroidales bacterium]MDD4043960.1 shikimate kinase [Bacteroidales bacterium]MDD4581090.1 shikimate kinase [Bacteroidales bacterium]
MRIYIIGFMGSGKSVFGKRLAAYANYDFMDLDVCFEATFQTTIFDFFTTYGEAAFRKKETALLRQSTDKDNIVISLGGGTPCYHNNMKWILENGLCVYLQLSPEVLYDRLLQAKQNRPLIHDLIPNELQNYIRKTLTEREKYYTQAQCIIPSINIKSQTVKLLFQRILETGNDIYK